MICQKFLPQIKNYCHSCEHFKETHADKRLDTSDIALQTILIVTDAILIKTNEIIN